MTDMHVKKELPSCPVVVGNKTSWRELHAHTGSFHSLDGFIISLMKNFLVNSEIIEIEND